MPRTWAHGTGNQLRYIKNLPHQFEQRLPVAFLVALIVDRGFRLEGSVGKARIVEQFAEGLKAHRAQADLLMPVEL